MVQNGVKTFMNETVLNIMFHVDLWMLKYISHLQCFVATKNRLKHEKILGKGVLVLDFISTQLGHLHSCSKVMGFFFAVAKYGVYF